MNGLMTEKDYDTGMDLIKTLIGEDSDECTNRSCELEALTMELWLYEERHYPIPGCTGCSHSPAVMLDENGTKCEISGMPGRWAHGQGDGWYACTNPPSEDANPVPYLFAPEMFAQGLASECLAEDCDEVSFVWDGECLGCGAKYPVPPSPNPDQVEIQLPGATYRQIIVYLESRVETGAVKFNDDWKGLFVRGDESIMLANSIRTVLESPGDCDLEKAVLQRYVEIIENGVLR